MLHPSINAYHEEHRSTEKTQRALSWRQKNEQTGYLDQNESLGIIYRQKH